MVASIDTPIFARAGGVGSALALPDTEAMQMYVDEIARHVAKGTPAVVLFDRAGMLPQISISVPIIELWRYLLFSGP
jgi:hypothetical protein